MADNIVEHPHRDLMAEAEHERSIVDSPEAEKLKGAVFDAVITYSDFLEQQGLIFEFSADPDNFCPRLKAAHWSSQGTTAATTEQLTSHSRMVPAIAYMATA